MLRQLGITSAASVDLITYYREVDEMLEKMKHSIENRGRKTLQFRPRSRRRPSQSWILMTSTILTRKSPGWKIPCWPLKSYCDSPAFANFCSNSDPLESGLRRLTERTRWFRYSRSRTSAPCSLRYFQRSARISPGRIPSNTASFTISRSRTDRETKHSFTCSIVMTNFVAVRPFSGVTNSRAGSFPVYRPCRGKHVARFRRSKHLRRPSFPPG